MTKSADREKLDNSGARSGLRIVKGLVACYAVFSILTLAAIVLLRDRPDLVTDAVWVRGTIVAITSLLMLSFTARAARGSSRGYLRLRIASAIMLIAIVVIIALPGDFPIWLKIEQAVCGLLLLGVVVIANGKRLRAAFASR